jgi:SPFH domain/Band 7 family protein
VPYALNPWFVSVVLVPVRQVTLEWTKRQQSDPHRYDAELDPIMIHIDGHKLTFEMTQIVRIPDRIAPRLVSEFGGSGGFGFGGLIDDPLPVQRFVHKILGSKVEAYFTSTATTMQGRYFQESFKELQPGLAHDIKGALEPWGVDAITTTLSQYDTDDEAFNKPMREAFAAESSVRVLQAQKETAGLRDEIDQVAYKQDLRRTEMQLRGLIDALGPAGARMIRIIQEYANMKVPGYIGGSDLDRIMGALPVPALTELLSRLEILRDDRPGAKPAGGIITGAQLVDQDEDSDL